MLLLKQSWKYGTKMAIDKTGTPVKWKDSLYHNTEICCHL